MHRTGWLYQVGALAGSLLAAACVRPHALAVSPDARHALESALAARFGRPSVVWYEAHVVRVEYDDERQFPDRKPGATSFAQERSEAIAKVTATVLADFGVVPDSVRVVLLEHLTAPVPTKNAAIISVNNMGRHTHTFAVNLLASARDTSTSHAP